jgi:two-component system, LytTR family, response regulator
VAIRTLIVDDEPLARTRIRSLLQDEADIEVVGECGDGKQAVVALRDLQPDLVFLDVQMPALDGFEVLEAVRGDRLPAVIFVTAYDRYAIRAFEHHALDYLLKPFDRDRFQKALARLRADLQRKQQASASQRLAAMLQDVQSSSRKPVQRLVIKSGGRIFFLRVEEIDWIEAAGNYVRLHVGKETHLLRETMNSLEGRLDGQQFVRIHRSTIVAMDRIKELQPWFHGDFKVILKDGGELTLSRGYRQKLQEMLGGSF